MPTMKLKETLLPRSHATSLSSESSDVWKGSLQHAVVVMESREKEMETFFDQLHEIQTDLSQMSDQVGVVRTNLQLCRRRRSAPSRKKPRQHRSMSTSVNVLTEDEMIDVVHRLLTQIGGITMARQEGRNEVPLIV